ncbi:hypothetical protein ADL21_11430 [Streptomyces albus subsp. albus]|nr:hypothetical protein ADL21_11430 [Streptomyces albus subsp. albus]
MIVSAWHTTRGAGTPMDVKHMRKSCAALIRDFDLPVPAAPEQVIAALCTRMGRRLGRPVHHRLAAFPPGTVSGLWVRTETAHYIVCEQRTSAWHQLLITGHEFWHMEAGHGATQLADDDARRLLFPTLGGEALVRLLGKRTHYCSEAEEEAEFFATLLVTRMSRWLPEQSWSAPAPWAANVTQRLETSLGPGTEERRS